MVEAKWNGTVIAESNRCEQVEGNFYFPPADVNMTRLKESEHRTTCGWKGVAHYYHVVVDDEVNENAAWFYPDPKPAAENIKDHIAFWRGVSVEA